MCMSMGINVRTLPPILQCGTHTRFIRILQHIFLCVLLHCFRWNLTHECKINYDPFAVIDCAICLNRCSQKSDFFFFFELFIWPQPNQTQFKIIFSISMNEYILSVAYIISRVAINHRLIRHMTHLSLRIKITLHNLQIHEHTQADESSACRQRHLTVLWVSIFSVHDVVKVIKIYSFSIWFPCCFVALCLFHVNICGKLLMIDDYRLREFRIFFLN